MRDHGMDSRMVGCILYLFLSGLKICWVDGRMLFLIRNKACQKVVAGQWLDR